MDERVNYTDRDEAAGTVERVVIRETADGVEYAMYYGTLDGRTLLRYDNAHGRHERHTPAGVEEIEFPGVGALLQRFYHEIAEVDPNSP